MAKSAYKQLLAHCVFHMRLSLFFGLMNMCVLAPWYAARLHAGNRSGWMWFFLATSVIAGYLNLTNHLHLRGRVRDYKALEAFARAHGHELE